MVTDTPERKRLNYDTFKAIADHLYEQQVEMPTASKTYKQLGYGSLRDHQLYLGRWQQEKKQKPSTLKERHEKAVVEKAKAFAEALLVEHGKEIKTFKSEATAQVNQAKAEVAQTLTTLEQSQQSCTSLMQQVEALILEKQEFLNEIENRKKEVIALEKAHITLRVQHEEMQLAHQQQLKLIEIQQLEKANQLKATELSLTIEQRKTSELVAQARQAERKYFEDQQQQENRYHVLLTEKQEVAHCLQETLKNIESNKQSQLAFTKAHEALKEQLAKTESKLQKQTTLTQQQIVNLAVSQSQNTQLCSQLENYAEQVANYKKQQESLLRQFSRLEKNLLESRNTSDIII